MAQRLETLSNRNLVLPRWSVEMQFINGTWTEAAGDEFTSFNPSTGQALWTGRASNSSDVDAAVASARDAVGEWRRLSVAKRSEFLLRFQSQLEDHRDSLARAISDEVGKPLWDAATEVNAMIGKIPVSIESMKDRRSEQRIELGGITGATRYKPHGVLAVFGPFNFPGHITNGHVIPALLAGNTIVMKPSELTPHVAEEMLRLWENAGLPSGVLNLIQGGRETGEALVRHPGHNGVLFTGSLPTGIALRRALVDQPQKILALELGGNNPLVIHHVSDIPAAVYWTVQSAFITSGQRCTCARRLIVTDGNQEFIDQLAAAIAKLKVDAADASPQPFMGPVATELAADRVLEEQDRLLQDGATAIVAARRLALGRAFVSPALLDVTNCSQASDCEVFGPLLQLIRVRDLDDAIEESNRTEFGLVAGLFSESAADFDRFYDGVDAGLINWNRPTTGASGRLPFGGTGLSGNHRPAGYFTIDFCNSPVATLEDSSLKLPEQRSPGIEF